MTVFGRFLTTIVASFVGLTTLATAAHAQAFDFESTPLGFYPGSLVLVNGAQTLTITPEGFPNGFVAVRDVGVPAQLGARSMVGSSVNPVEMDRFTPIRMAFAVPVGAITFAIGDGGGDEDSPVTIQAFSASNILLGILNEIHPAGLASKTIAGSFPGAAYFILSSTPGSNNNSLYWEVISSTPFTGSGNGAPEPGSILLFLAGIGVVTIARPQLVRQRGTPGFKRSPLVRICPHQRPER